MSMFNVVSPGGGGGGSPFGGGATSMWKTTAPGYGVHSPQQPPWQQSGVGSWGNQLGGLFQGIMNGPQQQHGQYGSQFTLPQPYGGTSGDYGAYAMRQRAYQTTGRAVPGSQPATGY